MTIQIDRFQIQEVRPNIKEIIVHDKTGVIIRDHMIDSNVCFVNVYDNLEKNKELADKILATIEEDILGADDGSSK